MGALSSLADIHGRPVIDRGRVFAVSHSGRMVAIDLRTGDRVWEQDIGGTQGPWVAGDYVYVLSNDVRLLCMTWKDGRVRWATQLPRYDNPEKKRDPIKWAGPILAGDRLIVISSDGVAFSVSPYTGKALGTIDFPYGVFVDPRGREQYALCHDLRSATDRAALGQARTMPPCPLPSPSSAGPTSANRLCSTGWLGAR